MKTQTHNAWDSYVVQCLNTDTMLDDMHCTYIPSCIVKYCIHSCKFRVMYITNYGKYLVYRDGNGITIHFENPSFTFSMGI